MGPAIDANGIQQCCAPKDTLGWIQRRIPQLLKQRTAQPEGTLRFLQLRLKQRVKSTFLPPGTATVDDRNPVITTDHRSPAALLTAPQQTLKPALLHSGDGPARGQQQAELPCLVAAATQWCQARLNGHHQAANGICHGLTPPTLELFDHAHGFSQSPALELAAPVGRLGVLVHRRPETGQTVMQGSLLLSP